MPNRKGFTLIEILIVMVIIAILAAITIPNYLTYMQQGAAKAAQNNLIAIYNGQKNYYFNPTNGSNFYNSPSPNDQSGIDSALPSGLGLSISDNNFQYTCATAAGSFTCAATNNSDAHLVLTVTNNPIVLNGGSTCASSTGANPGCNPSCATDVTAYCPS